MMNLQSLLTFKLKNGTDAIVVCGTTGESSTLKVVGAQRMHQVVR